jgi:glycosyltransferase involved in cell wall biosynthesis
MKQRAKLALRTLLLWPVVGWPLRLATFWVCEILNFLARAANGFLRRQPYAKRYASLFKMPPGQLDQYLGYLRNLRMEMEYLELKPKISVLVPVYNPPPAFLLECLESVAIQVYENWELCIVDDCSTDSRVQEILNDFAQRYPDRVRLDRNETNSHISATSNRCLQLATGEFVALLDHDDRLCPDALAEVVRHYNWRGETDIFYTDEQIIDESGNPIHQPFFKPGWSPQFHLRVNYTTHLSVYKRSLLQQIGGFRVGFEGSQDHDLMLRAVEASGLPVIHIPMVLYQWRAHSTSTAGALANKPYAAIAGERAVREQLERMRRPAEVGWDETTGHYRIKYELPMTTDGPLVSIVICSKDKPDLIRTCIESIRSKTVGITYEIVLVDNQTTDPECLEYFKKLEGEASSSAGGMSRFSWIRFDRPFNFAAMNNLGVKHAAGRFVVLLNNDTEVITPEWLTEMVGLAQFSEIGAVGPKLLFGNGRIQHAGVSLADRLVAFHMCSGMRANDNRYMDTLNTVHETAVVTGACLCIERSKYEKMNGLRDHFVPNGYGDVDFCTRLMRAGLANVYTPHAVLTHFESPSRKESFELFERHYLLREFGGEIVNDPYFNPNFQRTTDYTPSDYSLKFQLSGAAFRYILKTQPDQWSEAELRISK